MGEELLKAWLDGQLSKPVNNFEKAREKCTVSVLR